MSGIAGIVSLGGRGSVRRDIETMIQGIRHRGPDAHGSWVNSKETVGLGHSLLETTPQAELEDQPWRGRNKRVYLVADARLDNRDKLTQILDCKNRRISSVTDPEIITLSYLKWGRDCVNYLIGDFSFSVWDESNHSFFCARDPMGVKPFYYAKTSSSFAFASESRPILSLPFVTDSINEKHVITFLSGGYGSRAETSFKEIQKLKPGHTLHVTHELSMTSRRYWNPADHIERADRWNDHEYEQGFKDVLNEAVQAHLRSNTGVGIRLSGGMDSSSIASLANASSPGSSSSIYTFSGIFPSLPEEKKHRVDEQKYIDAVLKGAQFKSFFIDASKLSPFLGLDEMVEMRGEPFNLHAHYLLYKTLGIAQQHNVRNLLDGSEGDAVVGYGHDFFIELARAGEWERFTELAVRYSENCRQAGRHYPPEKAFWDHGLEPLLEYLRSGQPGKYYGNVCRVTDLFDIPLSKVLKRSMYWVWPSQWRKRIDRFRGKSALDVISSQKLRRLGVDGEENRTSTAPTHVRHARTLQKSAVLTSAMEAVDPIFAAHHAEARHPFFDRRVIEYCLSLPAEQRMKGGWSRSILRRALRDVLPDKVQNRLGKAMLGINIKHNLLHHEQNRLSELARDEILQPFVDRDVVEGLLNRFQESPSKPYSYAVGPLLRVAVLAIWLRKRRNGKLEGPLETTHAPKEKEEQNQ
ncbi:lasso peptide isopeptide bond-forming cyclase [Salinibacter altiplanensis]|uniref:lasso peptide isopeptide bond-forming cyclase n=1 Tax=Salinibacter altiplanensis TaxID=1803181 RepID=UPI000C9F59D8|nr:lasso peptide isopeptide bond-forming cyclase [Salinibacter altiplanensis]